MINPLLKQESFDTLIKLRKHFTRLANGVPGEEFRYNKPEYIRLKTILDDLDDIILEKCTTEEGSDGLTTKFI